MPMLNALYIRRIVVLILLLIVAAGCSGETNIPLDAADAQTDDSTPIDPQPADAQPDNIRDADTPDTAPPDTTEAPDATAPEDADTTADADTTDIPPEDVSPHGRWQSYFNQPTAANGYEDQTLRNRLVAYLNGAQPGSEVRAHITQLSSADALRPVVDALVNAHDRGVTIWMVHNGDANHFPELAARLGARYVHCGTPSATNNTACLSNVDNGTHHMKNWYFSHTIVGSNDYKFMVIASSYNITVTQSRYFNDMLVVSGNQALYDAHVAVYEDYLHQRKTDDRHSEPHGQIFVPTAATYTADFSPQKDGDMVADALARITQYEEGCTLGVGTLNMTRSTIYTQLERIKALGCEVRVITGTVLPDDKVARMDAAGIPHRLINATRNGHPVSLHSKMMVYRGYYDTPVAQHPKNNRGWVWTGSQNFTFTPLKFRDDVFVGISRGGVTTNYWDYYEVMWANGE